MNDYQNVINELLSAVKDKNEVETLQYLASKFESSIAFSTSFGQEDQIITDMIYANNIPIEIFTLDTGRLFPETYKVFSRTNEKYNRKIITYYPDTEKVEKLVSEKGPMSFYESVENRKECCYIRKVEPLTRALQNVKCWITGLRAGQSNVRQSINTFTWDENFNIIKYNPLVRWSLDEVLDYIKRKNVPYNSLHDKNFVSIGCQPCTRAIQEDEDIRAGRWWWEDNSKKECGLHTK